MSAISPVPVPISSMFFLPDVVAHAPNKTPSVPTFIAHLSWYTVNCLNLKNDVAMLLLNDVRKISGI